MINNLKSGNACHESQLTYRAGDHWISELDICVLSHTDLTCVKNFDVYDDLSQPSDHAPISVCVQPPKASREMSLGRAHLLGDYAVMYSSHKTHLEKPVKFSKIDVEHFLGELSRCDIPDCTDDVNANIDALIDIQYRCSNRSSRNLNPAAIDPAYSRWERLVNDSDDKRI